MKIYHLSTCNTCQKILQQIGEHYDLSQATLIDIKQQNITESDLDKVALAQGGYEAIFSKRAMKYRSLGLDKITISEAEYKKWMLQEYTFIKRPFLLVDEQIFVGNAASTIQSLLTYLKQKHG